MLPRPLIAVLLLALAAASANAQPDDVGQLDLQRLERQRTAEELRGQAQATAREIEGLRAKLVGLARAQVVDEATAGGQRARFEALNAQEQALALRMAGNRDRLTRLLAALQLYSRNPPPALLVSPHSATDAVRAAILMRAIAPELQRRARALKVEAEAFQRVRRQAVLAHEELFTTESEIADRRAEIERLIAQKTALERRLHADAAAAEAEARALAARVQSLGGLVRVLPSRQSGPVVELGPLTRPVQGRLLRRFGDPLASGGRSEGLAWRAEPSAQVVSPIAGRIDYAGPLSGWGQVVVISYGADWRIVIAGLDVVSVGTGRSVAAGEPIGRAPDDRRGDRQGGGELYMELRRRGDPVDPGRRLDGG